MSTFFVCGVGMNCAMIIRYTAIDAIIFEKIN